MIVNESAFKCLCFNERISDILNSKFKTVARQKAKKASKNNHKRLYINIIISIFAA